MRLRFSNVKDYAQTFIANDLDSFRREAIVALRIFRAATYRKVHRGEIKRDELWFDKVELHLEIDGRWLHPGLIKQTESGTDYFEPYQVRFALSAPDLDAIHMSDLDIFERSGELIWQGVHDCWRWNGALDAMLMTIGDDIERRVTDDES